MKKFIFILVILLSCQTVIKKNKLDEKSEDITNYFKNELVEKIPKNGIIVILQNQKCSSCRQSTFETLVNQHLIKSNLNKIFILANADSSLEKIISTIPSSKVIYDSQHKLKEYGLDYSTDLCFIFSNNNLSKYFEISNIEIEKLQSLN